MVPMAAQHAQIEVLESKTIGRRARRCPMHERLWKTGKIDGVEFDAVERFVADHAFLSRCGLSCGMVASSGGGAAGAADALMMASARYRVAVQHVGAWRVCYLVDACCDAMTGIAMARKYLHSDGGHARAEVEGMVLDAIRLLVGRDPHCQPGR